MKIPELLNTIEIDGYERYGSIHEESGGLLFHLMYYNRNPHPQNKKQEERGKAIKSESFFSVNKLEHIFTTIDINYLKPLGFSFHFLHLSKPLSILDYPQ